MFIFGFPNYWPRFLTEYPLYVEVLPNVFHAFDKVFNRTMTTSEPVDKLVFTLGHIAMENFHEVLLLSSNGLGLAGQEYSGVL